MHFFLFLIGFLVLNPIEACTRALFTGEDGTVMVGRSLDWAEDMFSDLYVFPRGLKRNSAAGDRSFDWTSKYGSVIVSGYHAGTVDGLNEKGLAANLLYLAESDYGPAIAGKPILTTPAWAQYALDNFATVSEAVDALAKETFTLQAPILPNNKPAQAHLALSDPTGDSAIFEYVNGKLVIHHGKEFTVMTNSPTYNQQLALNTYWESIGGTVFMPGTNRAADRFARAYFYITNIPRKVNPNIITAVPEKKFEYQAVASVLSVIRSVSVPLGTSTPNEPNIGTTFWRIVADQKNLVYYYDSATSPNAFWVRLSDLDFSEKAPVKELVLEGGKVYAGNTAKLFQEAKPFEFLPVKPL